MTLLLYLKAFHVIFLVAWFSGLFFLGRMFIYAQDALSKPEPDRSILLPYFLNAQTRVLYIIVLPALFATLCIGGGLMVVTQAYLQGWFHVKLLLVFGFLVYNVSCIKIHYRLWRSEPVMSDFKLRLFNEVPFVFLILISFTVFLRSFLSGLWQACVFLGVIFLVAYSVRFFKKRRSLS